MSSIPSLMDAIAGLSMSSTATRRTAVKREREPSMFSTDGLLIVQLKAILIIDSGSDGNAKEFSRPPGGWTLRRPGCPVESRPGQSAQLATSLQDLVREEGAPADDLVLVLDMKDAKEVEMPPNAIDDEDEARQVFKKGRIENPYSTPKKSLAGQNAHHKLGRRTSLKLKRPRSTSTAFGGLTNCMEVDGPANLAFIEEEETLMRSVVADKQPVETAVRPAADGELNMAGGLETEDLLRHSTDIDVDHGDPLLVSEYQDEIYKYFKELEGVTTTQIDFIEQPHINWKKRCILIDWLLEVHLRMKLLQETLLLAVNILDRFLVKRMVGEGKIGILGLCCLFIAIKYEEVYIPSIKVLLTLPLDRPFTASDILAGERYVLNVLDWDLRASGPLSWLRKASEADDYDVKARTLAKYLIDLALVKRKLIRVVPSLLSASALWLARVVSDRGTWNAKLEQSSTYSEDELLPVASIMVDCLLVQPSPHSALYDIYNKPRHFLASSVLQKWCLDRWPANSTVDLSKGFSNAIKESDTDRISFTILQPTKNLDTEMEP